MILVIQGRFSFPYDKFFVAGGWALGQENFILSIKRDVWFIYLKLVIENNTILKMVVNSCRFEFARVDGEFWTDWHVSF